MLYKRNYFIAVVLLMTIVNMLDMVTTYYVSPSLEYESNIWIKHLSLNFYGLVLVSIFFQLLNTFPLWYFCFRFKNADYDRRRKNNLYEIARIYLFNGITFNKTKCFLNRIISVITSFLGYYLPIQYIISKIVVSASNFTIGYFFRHVTINRKVGIDVDITYDHTNQLWQNLYGKFMLFYMQCSPGQKLTLQNLVTSSFATLFCFYFFIYEYKKAVSTPIGNNLIQYTNADESSKIMQSCYLWIAVYLLFFILGILLDVVS